MSTAPTSPTGPQATAQTPTSEPVVHTSPWTTGEKIGRLLWYLVQGTLFRWSPRRAWGWRSMLLRLFGAKIAPNCRIHNTVRVEIPWHLSMGTNSSAGEYAILYCLGPVTIGHDVSISQYAHLCAGTHEVETRRMLLLRPPVTVEPYAWVAADAFVGPGVTVGEGAILGARGCAFKDLEPWTIYGGNPAKKIRPRDKSDWAKVLGKQA